METKINQIYNPIKRLTRGKKSTGGRNCHGHITAFHRGGGHKRLYRIIDFKRSIGESNATVLDIQYDPSRTGKLALIAEEKVNAEGNNFIPSIKTSYILAAEGLKRGDTIKSVRTMPNTALYPGDSAPLKYIPIGTKIFNIELEPGKGGQLARSGGCSASLIGHGSRVVKNSPVVKVLAAVRLSSGETVVLNGDNIATIGESASTPPTLLRKAGQMRWRGRRPIVRGVAMNPIDHPHGGGEGKSKGRPSVTPWGKPTKGYKTRKRPRVIATLPEAKL
jgi:large subunit ribosomal protein L2|uniref:Ribosomal protein L2 n=1 Tax=Diphylleia rotans TaxID=190327 RepID=A0A146I701_9EUKA|nr:ribosomal protein L2 [Diphylleia rotans]BAU71453.1 ribosomal protein L2 [Diphylleia rotans]